MGEFRQVALLSPEVMPPVVEVPRWDLVPAPGWRLRCAPHATRPQLRAPESLARLVLPRLAGADREVCLLASLDTKRRLLALSTVSVGTAARTFIAPREVFRDALLDGAAAIALAHNHPSGDPTPSEDDQRVTRRLAEAGILLGVSLVDHLIVGDGQWKSMAREGML